MVRRGVPNFQLSNLAMATLTVAILTTSVVVFLLGFYVGRDTAFRHRGAEALVARLPVTAPADRPADASPQDPLANPGEVGTQSDMDSDDTVSGDGARAPAPGTAESAAPKLLGPPPIRLLDDAGTPPGAVAADQAQDAQGQEAGAQDDAGQFSVQVLATRSRAEAETLVGRLKEGGFDAYVRTVPGDGGAWHRVRVGRFATPAAAKGMAERCRKEMGLEDAYISTY